jgi:hypothetical protein
MKEVDLSMAHEPKHVVITDPREFDGDPFEVAERAVNQAGALTTILRSNVELAFVMARNAEMERQIIDTGEPSAADFETSVHARKLQKIVADLRDAEKTLRTLARAVGFNPKAPLGRD